MQPPVRTECSETSYSALLHGPDTPPLHHESSWDYSAGTSSFFATQNCFAQQMRSDSKQKLPRRDISSEGADAREQELLYPNVGLWVMQHPSSYPVENGSTHQTNSALAFHDPRSGQHHFNRGWVAENRLHFKPSEQGHASLSSNGQNFMQALQGVKSSSSEKRVVEHPCAHPREAVLEDHCLKKPESVAFPVRLIPTGQMQGDFDPEHCSLWNVMHSQSMNAADGSYMQHSLGGSYGCWDARAWADGHSYMQHTQYLPYSSGHMQICHPPYNYQTTATEVMADTYPQNYPEAYCSNGNSFSSIGETNNVVPPSFLNCSDHVQKFQVQLPPANKVFPQSRASANEGDFSNMLNRTFTANVHTSQMNPEVPATAGGQELRITCKVAHVGQSSNAFKKCRDEVGIANTNPDKDHAHHEKDVEIKGPQTKRLRETSEIESYQIKSCHWSGKDAPHSTATSPTNVTQLSCVEVGAKQISNFSHVRGGNVEERCGQVRSHCCHHIAGTDQQGQSSEQITKDSQGSGTPPCLCAKTATQAEISSNLLPRHMPHTSPRLPQSYPVPKMMFFPSTQWKEHEHKTNNCFIPGAYCDGYKEEYSSNQRRASVNGAQNQSFPDHPFGQSAGQAHLGSHQFLPTPVNVFMPQQVPILSVSAKTAAAGNTLPSGTLTQEQKEAWGTVVELSHGVMCPMNKASLIFTDTNQYTHDIPDPTFSYAFADEQLPSSFQPQVEKFRTSYSLTSSYPSHLHSSVHKTEHKSFEQSEAGPASSHQLGFDRPAWQSFYSRFPFPSHFANFQGECGRDTSLQIEKDGLPKVQALKNGEASIVSGGAKEANLKLQAKTRYVVEGQFLCSASGDTEIMRTGSTLWEPTLMGNHFPSSEAWNMSLQHPDNTSNVQAANKSLSMSIANQAASNSTTMGSQRLAGPRQIVLGNEIFNSACPLGHPECLDIGKCSRPDTMYQHLSPGHCHDMITVARVCPTLINSETAVSGVTSSEQAPQMVSHMNHQGTYVLQPKKRKKPVSCLVPWHALLCQSKCQLPSISKAELMWATVTNRLVDKDGGGDLTKMGSLKAEARLKLGTQLMQQIFPPLPSVLTHGGQFASLEYGIFSLSKSALGEACRLLNGTERENDTQKIADMKTMASNGLTRTLNTAKEVAMMNLVERLMERVKCLDIELARLDCSMSVLSIRNKNHEFERVSMVHRLGKHHGPEFGLSLSEDTLTDIITRNGVSNRTFPPQRYVIAVPMPRTLPEGTRCLSL